MYTSLWGLICTEGDLVGVQQCLGLRMSTYAQTCVLNSHFSGKPGLTRSLLFVFTTAEITCSSHIALLLPPDFYGKNVTVHIVSKWGTNLWSAKTRIDPLHFQAGCHWRRLNLALVFLCLFCFVVPFFSQVAVHNITSPELVSIPTGLNAHLHN